MKELLERKKGLHRRILIVDDGAVALNITKTQRENISLIILDLHMPELDGVSLLKIIRTDSELRRIPVIVLTSEKGSEVECLQMGAADFITKPYDAPEVVRARVARSIELAEDSVIIHETERDILTGLFNKEFFFEYGKRLNKQNNIPMDALVIDINHFHIVNELYGRAYGNIILQRLGNNIHDLVRRTGGLACRSENDSFYIYIPHDDELEKKLPQFIEKISEVFSEHKISIRIGIYSDDGNDLDIERHFDYAKRASQSIRNKYTTSFNFYDSEFHKKELFAERLINEMDKALTDKQFKVFYQPKYNITGDVPKLVSAEALIRWDHPEYGMISPGLFIPLFEHNGLIHKLDMYVWNEAAGQIRKWREMFGLTLPVSVNVSRVDVFDPTLLDQLDSIVSKNSVSSEDLMLEITETAYTDDSDKFNEIIFGLRNKGFKIEMDDFGSGYSSLNVVTSLDIDVLKLDMQFIKNICSDTKNSKLVSIMIDIARLLEVPVVAEGVETREQMLLLKEIGCDIVQGYYFSKPLPVDEFEALIKKEIQGE